MDKIYTGTVPAPYTYKMNVFAMQVEVPGLTTQFTAFDRMWIAREHFHISLVITRYSIPTLMERDGLSEEMAEEKLRNVVVEALEKHAPMLSHLTGEIRQVKRGSDETLIAMAEVANLEEFYTHINQSLDLSLDIPPTHVTFYMTAGTKAISVVNADELASETRLLSAAEAEEVMAKSGLWPEDVRLLAE